MKLIDFTSPPLSKFCPPEFNIKNGCNTIRFGTLFDFRAEEDMKLRDEGEGTFSYSIKFPELRKVSPEWLREFEVDADGSARIGTFEMRGSEIYVNDLSISGSSHNCWIYCMSKSEADAGNISETHDDKWTISTERFPAFGNYLAALLWSQVSLLDLPKSIVEGFSFQEIHQRLSLNLEIKEVEYIDRTKIIQDEKDFPLSEIITLKNRIAFIKPKIFEREKEVRLAFWLLFDNKKISIENRPKIVSLRQVDQFI